MKSKIEYTLKVDLERDAMQIQLPDEFNEGIEMVARLCGCTWGERGNVKEMLRMIATGALFPTPSGVDSFDRIAECDRLIRSRQPFSVLYRDSQGILKTWTVCYGEIKFYEKRLYLDAWTLEEQDSELGLSHNACFRPDRMLEITPCQSKWRDQGFDKVTVKMALYNRLATAYEKRDIDVSLELEEGRLIVQRTISNPFWFVRSILPYGSDCEILEPAPLRKQVASDAIQNARRYEDLNN